MGTRVGLALLLCAALACGETFTLRYLKGDAKTRAKLAAQPNLDVYGEAHVFFNYFLDFKDRKALDAIADLAGRTGSDGLAALIAQWKQLDEKQLAKERERRDLLAKIWGELNANKHAAALKIAADPGKLERTPTFTLAYLHLAGGFAADRLGRNGDAADRFLAAAREAQRLGYGGLHLFALENSALKAQAADRLEAAEQAFLEVLKIQQDTKHPGTAATLINLGEAVRKQGRARESIDYYERGLAAAQRVRHGVWASNALGGLGMAYAAIGQVPRAVGYMNRSRKLKLRFGDKAGAAYASYELSEIHIRAGEFQAALRCARQALEEREKLPGRPDIALSHWRVGSVLAELDRAQEGLEHLRTARKIFVDAECSTRPGATRRRARTSRNRSRSTAGCSRTPGCSTA
jgi:tetratricopeptide (TPR) repeat protein